MIVLYTRDAMKKHYLKHLLKMQWSDRVALMSYAMKIPFYQFALNKLGYNRFQELFLNSRADIHVEDDVDYAKRHGQLINFAVNGVAGADNCLLRSVMLTRMLKRKGFPVEIKFGVKKNTDAFMAHSWVEFGGVPVNDGDNTSKYHVFEMTDN